MFNFEKVRHPLNALVLHTDDAEASRMRGEWKCTIEVSTDEKTTLAIRRTKYFMIVVDEELRGIFSVKQWGFNIEPAGTVVVQFSRFTDECHLIGVHVPHDFNCTPGNDESELERCFSNSPSKVTNAPDPASAALNLENGAMAIARYYGLSRSQVSITLRDSSNN